MRTWLYLGFAILTEVSGTTMMKLSRGFERPQFFAIALVCYLGTLSMLTLALKGLPMGVVYAVWAGVGTSLAALVGLVVFKEPLTAMRLGGVALVAAGVVLINLQKAAS
jgi:small multidrug resistance pump